MNESDADNYQQTEETTWQHLDFYVRRVEGKLVLVQTLLRIDPDGGQEICTFYIDSDQLEEDWAEAVITQGADLEEGKSADFVPPDEIDFYDSEMDSQGEDYYW